MIEENEILFSIIVPVYNTEKYIKKCLESIKVAIDLDCEVIIINDGSTDNSETIIKKFINSLSPIYKKRFIYKKKENKGLSDTKNVGISLARGQYISVVDSDDYISDDFYTIARKYVGKYSVIIYDLYIVHERHKEYNYTARACMEGKNDQILGFLSGAMQGSSCNKIIKRELYSNYQFPTNVEYEDVAVTPFILIDADKIKYVPYPLYYYLQREKSIVSTNTLISAFYKICENISKQITKTKDLDKYKYIINEFFIERLLENLYEDYKKNNTKFINNIKIFSQNNKSVIKYIIDNDTIHKLENHYSKRQKDLLNYICIDLYNEKYIDIKLKLFTKRFINYIRRTVKSFTNFIFILIGGTRWKK
ncbi:MAG: glycosyltransferase family A protein [Clostridia bacterium]|nr:glycosyltransferase family A protein [Clostridia bacterium]